MKNKTEKVSCAIYARTAVKNDEQINEQIKSLSKSVEKDGGLLVGVYADNGFSGNDAERPALNRLFEDAKNGVFKTLYAKDTTRLKRGL